MGRLAKTRFVGAAVTVAVLAVCVALLSGMPRAQQDENVMRDFQGNPVPVEQAERIRAADAEWPLASRVKAYDAGGERIALSDVDPESYEGFVATLNNDDPDTARRLEEAQAAGAVTSTDGTIAAFDSIESFSQYFDEGNLSAIEPNYKVYLAGDSLAFEGLPDELRAELASAQLTSDGETVSPNDPLAFDQTDLELIHVKDAWDAGATGEDVVVGVVDSGLVGTDPNNTFGYKLKDYQHEDLDYRGHILEGWDFSKVINGTRGPTPDGVGHGTFITGQLVATQGNKKGVTGIAPRAKVQPFKTHDEKGAGSTVHIYYALMKVLENLSDPAEPHVDVLNLSLINTNPAEHMERAYKALADSGVIIVAATGNQASSAPTYPASYDCVIGVSATKKSGVFDPSYSNYGAGSVYVAAPGTNIMGIDRVVMGSIIIGDTNRGPDVYSNASGTSMACPEVAGLAALAKSIDKNIDQYEFMSRLRATSVDMGDVGYDQYYGWGVIDCGALITGMQMPDEVYASGSMSGIDWYITNADAPNPHQLVLSRGGGASSGSGESSWAEHVSVVKSVYANPRVEGGSWLSGAFSGMTSVEAILLGNVSVPADVSCRDLFSGLGRLNEIELGAGWLASVDFPDPPGTNCVTGWSAASTKQEYALGAAMPVGVAETYNAVYSHSYETVGDSIPPTLHEPGVATQRCRVCGHETYVYSYVDPASAGAPHYGTIDGGVGWYITPESYVPAPNRLIIYPLNGAAGTIARPGAPINSGWPWDEQRSLIRSVFVAPGVNAGVSMTYMFRGMTSCTEMDLGNLDVSGVGYMDYAFYGCTALERLDLSAWSPSSCDRIPYLFAQCTSLRELIMPSESFAALREAKQALSGCSKVTEIDLSGIKFYEETNTDRFFGNCGFEKITLKGNWNTDLSIPVRYPGHAQDEHGHIFSGKWEAEDGTAYSPDKLKGVKGTLVPYIAHKWGPPTVVSTGTCGSARQYTCTLCGKIKTEPIEGSGSHELAHAPSQNATCEQAGYREYWHCAKCGTLFADAEGKQAIEAVEEVPALGHDRRQAPSTEPTCTEGGTVGGEHCVRCDKVFSTSTEVPALGHNYEVRENSATCTEAGVTTSVCKRCGHTLVQENAAALGHDYVTTETPATCTEAATIVHTCTRCGDTRTEEGAAALGHNHAMTETPPTCTEAGHLTYSCTRCDDSYTQEGASALGHDYAATEVGPTCTEAGRITHACTRCRDTYSEAGAPALGHDFSREVSPAVAPTCTAEGASAVMGCSRCEERTGGEPVPKADHAPGAPERENEVAATCERGGSYDEVTRCSACRAQLSSDHRATDPLGHDYAVTETSATCTQAGTTAYACKRCNHSYVEEGAAALGHDYVVTETSATCTSPGVATHACKRCSHSYTDAGAPALGHDYAATEVGPTCTEAGRITHACTRCRDTYSEAGAPALGHDFSREVSPAVAPTCTAEGASAVMGCSRCEERTGGEPVPKADHAPGAPERENEVAATCERGGSYDEVTRCSACRAQLSSDHRATDPLGHDYDVTEKAPTCTEDGQVSYACKRCGHAYDEGKPALGHDDAIVHTPATCTEAGSSAHTCKRCGRSFVEAGEPALGHNYALEHVPPTCTEPGQITYTCKRCPDTYTEVGTASLGHDYAVTETPATCTEAAQIVCACTRCDDTHTEEGAPALGHDYVVTEVEPTCTEAGTSVHACTRCDDSFAEEGAAALGHDYVVTETAATCTEAAQIVHACKRCDDTRTEEGASALGHDFSREASPAVAPTCDQEGRSAVMGCTRCDARQGGEAVPKVDHVWTGPLWQWASDMGSAQATFVCEKYAHHKRVLNAEVSVRDATACASMSRPSRCPKSPAMTATTLMATTTAAATTTIPPEMATTTTAATMVAMATRTILAATTPTATTSRAAA